MNKVMAILLALGVQFAFAQAVWDGSADTTWYTKNKSAKEFTITTAKQLAGLAKLVNGGTDMYGKTINLGTNIMLNDTTNRKNWNNSPPAKTWVPIGSEDNPFRGTFSGKSNKVAGVYINSESDFQGLFGHIGSGGTIKVLVVSDSYIKGKKHVGGLVGSNLDGDIISGHFIGTVKGAKYVGGFAGSNGGKIVASHSYGTVEGHEIVGGFVGLNDDSMIGYCSFIGTVIGEEDIIGGFVGMNKGTKGIIGYSYSVGKVDGGDFVGGFVGGNSGAVVNNYSDSKVNGKELVGGLVGYNDGNGDITNSYSIGIVTGKASSSVGGLVGTNEGAINRSYYDKQTSKQSDKGKGEGKTSAQLKQKATFAGWDFEKVWYIKSTVNDGYPSLFDFLER